MLQNNCNTESYSSAPHEVSFITALHIIDELSIRSLFESRSSVTVHMLTAAVTLVVEMLHCVTIWLMIAKHFFVLPVYFNLTVSTLISGRHRLKCGHLTCWPTWRTLSWSSD